MKMRFNNNSILDKFKMNKKMKRKKQNKLKPKQK